MEQQTAAQPSIEGVLDDESEHVRVGLKDISDAIQSNISCMVVAVIGTSSVGKTFFKNWALQNNVAALRDEKLSWDATAKIRFFRHDYKLPPHQESVRAESQSREDFEQDLVEGSAGADGPAQSSTHGSSERQIRIFYFDIPGEYFTNTISTMLEQLVKAPQGRELLSEDEVNKFNLVLSVLMMADAYLLAVSSTPLSVPDDQWGAVLPGSGQKADEAIIPWPGEGPAQRADAWARHVYHGRNVTVSQWAGSRPPVERFEDSEVRHPNAPGGFVPNALKLLHGIGVFCDTATPKSIVSMLQGLDLNIYRRINRVQFDPRKKVRSRPLVVGFTKYDRILLGRQAWNHLNGESTSDAELATLSAPRELIEMQKQRDETKFFPEHGTTLGHISQQLDEAARKFEQFAVLPLSASLPRMSRGSVEFPKPDADVGSIGIREAVNWLAECTLRASEVKGLVAADGKREADANKDVDRLQTELEDLEQKLRELPSRSGVGRPVLFVPKVPVRATGRSPLSGILAGIGRFIGWFLTLDVRKVGQQQG